MSMIVRIWRGQAARGEKAEAYHRHVTQTVFPALTAIRGHIGAYLLTRKVDERIEFLAVTLWHSMDAIKEFTSGEPDLAVVEPEARAVLAEFDGFVRHYEVAHSSGCGGS